MASLEMPAALVLFRIVAESDSWISGSAEIRRRISASPISGGRGNRARSSTALARGDLVKKALAIAPLAIERQPGPFQSTSDQADMKALLDELIESDTELEHYARAARIAVTGNPD